MKCPVLHMTTLFKIFFSLVLISFSCSLFAQKPLAELELVSIHPKPVIGKGYKGAEDNKFGFEGGTCQKVEGVYYLFTTEIFDEPKTAATRLGIWTSKNGLDFKRHGTIVETNRNWYDTTHRMSPWSPMVVFDPDRDVWSVFHVGYRRKPNATTVFNMSGKIFRYDSKVKGKKGIGGPYQEGGWIQMAGKPEWWEGPGLILSFYPYRVGKEWWAIYGSNNVPQHVNSDGSGGGNGKNIFYSGMAKAEGGITGKWVRQPQLNPLKINPVFIENSVVTKVAPDLYINLYDGGKQNEIGYSCSRDGINWGKEQLIKLENRPAWIKYPRTPLCLIDEGKGIYTIYSTAFDGNNPEKIEPQWHQGFGSVGRIQVRLKVL
jgi:hypothetical protein